MALPSSVPLFTRQAIESSGVSSRSLSSRRASGELVRIRPGVFAAGEAWKTASSDQRMVARARAWNEVSASNPLFSHESAAALHGLPLLTDSGKVHVTIPTSRPGAGAGVVRHGTPVDDAEVVLVNGMRCTSLARTVADIACTARPEQALSVADAALRLIAWRDAERYDFAAASDFHADVLAMLADRTRGARRARSIIRFADGRAQLPGESISRLYLVRLGFATPSLQVPVAGPGGRRYYVDLGLDDVEAFGEFDGKSKYLDIARREGRSLDAVLLEEKEREDWIRGTTGRRFARWGWKDLASPQSLQARLAAFSLSAPRRAGTTGPSGRRTYTGADFLRPGV